MYQQSQATFSTFSLKLIRRESEKTTALSCVFPPQTEDFSIFYQQTQASGIPRWVPSQRIPKFTFSQQ
jgi:hypothetical protein